MKVCTKESILDQLREARDELGVMLVVKEDLKPNQAETVKRARIAIKNAIDFVRVV